MCCTETHYPHASLSSVSTTCLERLLVNERQLFQIDKGKKKNRRYHTQTITDTDYTDYRALLANTSAQAETLLHCLERAAAVIGLHVNAHKKECMCFKQRGDISTINGNSLELVDNFTYLGSSLSSTETGVNTQLAKSYGSQTCLIK